MSLFQSTLSVRRATGEYVDIDVLLLISIHALRKESDQGEGVGGSSVCHFNPRSP